jgi:wyosine [tRNA(Phe)-imidazoG37] synthetase (radical SAM superfamily)
LEGLIALRCEYTGKMWVEVMLVRDLNDSDAPLHAIADALARICPDEVHINLPTRPPVETWVQPPDEEGLSRARAILGDVAHVVHPSKRTFDLSASDSLLDAILGVIRRHPLSQDDLLSALQNWPPEDVVAVLTELQDSGAAQAVERHGIIFWSAADSFYPEEMQSQRTKPKSF